ncbi:TPA: hypothetical protein I8455_002970, partial [Aeromonas hydrophila]|nr:hypothetical protein [Aeromonas hydrophila]HAT2383850.1 hypothetical protein [Aeromonas hydrophila]HAT2416260.1 hypothetical protein [Aeromonas hydrophila]HAT2526999.1 hypothetical protein [Aeromonas hydrophila]HAT2546970.1 hypothetical protein [Aeromonas hydrophila]
TIGTINTVSAINTISIVHAIGTGITARFREPLAIVRRRTVITGRAGRAGLQRGAEQSAKQQQQRVEGTSRFHGIDQV